MKGVLGSRRLGNKDETTTRQLFAIRSRPENSEYLITCGPRRSSWPLSFFRFHHFSNIFPIHCTLEFWRLFDVCQCVCPCMSLCCSLGNVVKPVPGMWFCLSVCYLVSDFSCVTLERVSLSLSVSVFVSLGLSVSLCVMFVFMYVCVSVCLFEWAWFCVSEFV